MGMSSEEQDQRLKTSIELKGQKQFLWAETTNCQQSGVMHED